MTESPRPACPQALAACRILIIDDEAADVRLLEQLLSLGGYANCRSTTDARHALRLCEELQPDLVLVGLPMRLLDGYAVMRQLGTLGAPETGPPLLVLTSEATPHAKQQAVLAGARDFLTKPLDLTEVLLRVRNLLVIRQLHLQLAARDALLEAREPAVARDFDGGQDEILDRLALAAEYRDDQTGGHAKRVGILSERLARILGFAPPRVALMRRAAALHDVGKVGIPDSIVLRSGVLSPEEMAVMKTHTLLGARILSGSPWPVLQMAQTIALTHHERWDGTGYPNGLAGEAIPLDGRIVAVADAFDAMVRDRPYRKAMRAEEALEELLRQSGRQFDPGVVEVMVRETQRSLLKLAHAVVDKAEVEDVAARRGQFPAYTGD